jgi:hypothetical protein
MGYEKIEIPSLTQEEATRLMQSLERAKRKCLATGKLHFVSVYFEKGLTYFTESHQMVIIK